MANHIKDWFSKLQKASRLIKDCFKTDFEELEMQSKTSNFNNV